MENKMNEVQQTILSPEVIRALILNGDISKLTEDQKVQYYKYTCERVGLDYKANPFQFLKLQGKEVLYLVRAGAQQLNQLHKVSHQITSRELIPDAGIYQVTARASQPDGRYTESIGAVNIQGLKGDAYANAIMKAETKAKRRSTLDLLGLGMLDETEVETIPNAKPIEVERLPETKPEVADFNPALSKCKTFDDITTIYNTMNDDEKKAYYNLLQITKRRIYRDNFETTLKNLQKRHWTDKKQMDLEDVIGAEEDKEKKQEMIKTLEERLEKLGIEYKYEALPWD